MSDVAIASIQFPSRDELTHAYTNACEEISSCTDNSRYCEIANRFLCVAEKALTDFFLLKNGGQAIKEIIAFGSSEAGSTVTFFGVNYQKATFDYAEFTNGMIEYISNFNDDNEFTDEMIEKLDGVISKDAEFTSSLFSKEHCGSVNPQVQLKISDGVTHINLLVNLVNREIKEKKELPYSRSKYTDKLLASSCVNMVFMCSTGIIDQIEDMRDAIMETPGDTSEDEPIKLEYAVF